MTWKSFLEIFSEYVYTKKELRLTLSHKDLSSFIGNTIPMSVVECQEFRFTSLQQEIIIKNLNKINEMIESFEVYMLQRYPPKSSSSIPPVRSTEMSSTFI